MSEAASAAWTEGRRPIMPVLIAGGVGLLLCALGALIDSSAFFRSYLVAWLFWLAFPIGSLAILMVHAMTGGRWGMVLQSIFEAAIETVPLLAVLFVPIAFGMQSLYPWADPHVVAEDALLQHKAPYL